MTMIHTMWRYGWVDNKGAGENPRLFALICRNVAGKAHCAFRGDSKAKLKFFLPPLKDVRGGVERSETEGI